MGSTSFQINDGDVTTCITLDLKVPFVVSISLAQLVEVSEVVVTTKGGTSIPRFRKFVFDVLVVLFFFLPLCVCVYV